MSDEQDESKMFKELLYVGTKQFCRSFCGGSGYGHWRIEENIKDFLYNDLKSEERVDDLKKIIKHLNKKDSDIVEKLFNEEQAFSCIMRIHLFSKPKDLIDLFLKRR